MKSRSKAQAHAYAALAACLAILLLAPAALAENNWRDVFCVEAQQVMAGTTLAASLQVHTEFDAFVESKASDTPFAVQQFLSNVGADGLPRTLSCKMRTAERINATQPLARQGLAATGDTDCTAVHRRMLRNVLADMPAGDVALEPDRIVLEEDDTTYIGPRWIEPWPFHAARTGESGVLHLRARALYAPHAWWIPMPARFKGNYYCHLVAPDYLEALLRGAAVAGS